MSERIAKPSGTGVQARERTGRTVYPGQSATQNAHLRARGGVAQPAQNAAARPDARSVFDAVQIRLDGRTCRELPRASKKEWLLTNGIGGYAMTTVTGLNTRRQHGLLVVPMRQPVGRVVVLSKMDETLMLPQGPVPLDTNFYPGVVHPRGCEYIDGFSLYPHPTLVWAGPGWRIEKTVSLVHGEHTVVVSYRMLPPYRPRRTEKKGKAARAAGGVPETGAPGVPSTAGADAQQRATAGGAAASGTATPATPGAVAGNPRPLTGPADSPPLEHLVLRVRPLFAFRAVGELGRESARLERTVGLRDLEPSGSVVRCTPYAEWEPVYLVCPQARLVESSDWYKNLEYPQDRYAGLEHREDLWSYGYYEATLSAGEPLTIVCTLQGSEKRPLVWPVEREVERRAQLMAQVPDDKPLAKRLALAADQFVVRRERDTTAIVAGYPWLPDHARDTMIALPGLLLLGGRFREAKSILRSHARALDRGLLPNKLPEGSERAEYSSVDATLWFFVAVFRYLQYTGDFDFVKTELRIPMLETVRYFTEGTRYGIQVDSDGMLRCGEPGRMLTWMDERIGDVPVTPRAGKPVEVNALWYNGLRILERLAERFSIPSDMARFGKMAEKVEENFLATFWNGAFGCLQDVVEPSGPDGSIRPNQIFAVSLPFPLLDSESAQSVVRVVGEKLFVPHGLRTLDPQHPDFKPVYDGDAATRGAALHQGTAWAWLLGPYLTAMVKAQGAAGRLEAAKLLKPLEQHLTEDGLGQVSQLFWGGPPHWARGCPAHAAAVGELLRAYVEDVLGKNPGRAPSVQEPPLRPR